MTRQYINYNSVNSLLFLVVSMTAMAVLLKGYYFVIAFLLEMSAFWLRFTWKQGLQETKSWIVR